MNHFRIIGPFVALVALTPVSLLAGDEHETQRSFEMIMTSKYSMDGEGKTDKISADARIKYTQRRSGSKVEVLCDSVHSKVRQNDLDKIEVNEDKSGLVFNMAGADKIEFTSEKGTDAQKEMLADSFTLPIATVELDADGKETRRTVTDASGARKLVKEGIVQKMRLLHLPFFAAKDKWTAKTEIGMGLGEGFLSGDLTVEKTNLAGNLQTVSVKGTVFPTFDKGEDASVKNAVCEVTGTQTFDTTAKEWHSGKWSITVKYEIYSHENLMGKISGTMDIEWPAQKR
jgi:hypothetical protein